MADIGEGYFSNIFNSLKRGFLALMLPVLILGGIYGVFAPIGIPIYRDRGRCSLRGLRDLR